MQTYLETNHTKLFSSSKKKIFDLQTEIISFLKVHHADSPNCIFIALRYTFYSRAEFVHRSVLGCKNILIKQLQETDNLPEFMFHLSVNNIPHEDFIVDFIKVEDFTWP